MMYVVLQCAAEISGLGVDSQNWFKEVSSKCIYKLEQNCSLKWL